MRNTVIAATLGVLALAGCSTSAPAQPTTSSSTAAEPVSGVPSPDAGQAQDLLAALAKIDPALDHKRSVSRARDTCQAILDGQDEQKVVAAAQKRFDGSADIDLGDAKAILKVVKDSGWCR